MELVSAPSAVRAAPGLDPDAVFELAGLLLDGDVVVLTGAGVSTDSGIPDYRGPSGAARRHTPMTYQAFVGDPAARHRYWARSYLGWPSMAAARPNAVHREVAGWDGLGLLRGLITQNVDGLHQAAGSRNAIELHGGLDRTVCLRCGDRADRREIDRRLREANPDFDAHILAVNPDGDADIPDGELDRFTMIRCGVCGDGPLKPDVVFFGETVPKTRVEDCYALVEACSSLLVLGSSLTVMSGYRFVRRAAQLGRPVAIINAGATRGDPQATLRIDADLAGVLAALPV